MARNRNSAEEVTAAVAAAWENVEKNAQALVQAQEAGVSASAWQRLLRLKNAKFLALGMIPIVSYVIAGFFLPVSYAVEIVGFGAVAREIVQQFLGQTLMTNILGWALFPLLVFVVEIWTGLMIKKTREAAEYSPLEMRGARMWKVLGIIQAIAMPSAVIATAWASALADGASPLSGYRPFFMVCMLVISIVIHASIIFGIGYLVEAWAYFRFRRQDSKLSAQIAMSEGATVTYSSKVKFSFMQYVGMMAEARQVLQIVQHEPFAAATLKVLQDMFPNHPNLKAS